MTTVTRSAAETEQLGRSLGMALNSGAFIALHGDLGGGKTCFTRGIVSAVAPASQHLVASPTFAIMNEYAGDPPVFHFDFYRLSGPCEILELGFDDYFEGDGVCVVEWADRLGDLLPPRHIAIEFEQAGGDSRRITMTASTPELEQTLKSLELL